MSLFVASCVLSVSIHALLKYSRKINLPATLWYLQFADITLHRIRKIQARSFPLLACMRLHLTERAAHALDRTHPTTAHTEAKAACRSDVSAEMDPC